MPIPQSYLGDPVKFRLIHGGSETFHVPHLHGGGIQWQRQQDGPGARRGRAPTMCRSMPGLQKQFMSSMPSSGNDSAKPSVRRKPMSSISPAVRAAASRPSATSCSIATWRRTMSRACGIFGGFTTPCRIAAARPTSLAIWPELPDRQGQIERAVTSEELIGDHRRIRRSGRWPSMKKFWPRWSNSSCRRAACRFMSKTPRFSIGPARAIFTSTSLETHYAWPNYVSATPG